MKTHLTELLTQAAKAVAPDLQDFSILIERPKTAQHGDFATNLAMLLARSLKQNPRALAEALVKALPTSQYVAKAEIAGAGFINFFMTPAARAAVVGQILTEGARYGQNDSGKGHKVMVEFVSANPTGPLHVGHGRGAAVGDCLCRVLARDRLECDARVLLQRCRRADRQPYAVGAIALQGHHAG